MRLPFLNSLSKIACLACALATLTFAADPLPVTEEMPSTHPKPWETSVWTVESGALWEIGSGTPFPYRLLETQVSWKSKEFITKVFEDGSRVIVRNRFALIGAIMQQGPESHYIAVSASPSLEWWNAAGTWSVYGGSGGGAGGLDSQGVKGGEGQDFTLNWMMRGGIEHAFSPTSRLSAGIMYQHMSNGGQTKPNPGIDALGFMVGYSWSH
ncbi:MAG: acyloxyacyl hydrolase [Opitutaceae bacterium]